MTKGLIIGTSGEFDDEESPPTVTTGDQPQAPWSTIVLSDEAVRKPLFDPPATWYVLLLPLPAKVETEGGIALADSSQEAQRVFANVGEVLAVGPAVYTGKTNSGIDMKLLDKPKVGEYWAYPQHSGQRYYLRERHSNGAVAYQLAIKDSELMGCVSPEQFKRIIVWV